MKSFILTAKTELARDLLPEFAKTHKKAIVETLNENQIKITFKDKLVSLTVNADILYLFLKRLGLTKKDFEVETCN